MARARTHDERKAISAERKFQNRISKLRAENQDLIIVEMCRCGCDRKHHDPHCWVCMECDTYRRSFMIVRSS